MDDELSSDILEKQFGPTAVEVLYQDDLTRIIVTSAADSGQILELSYVRFRPASTSKFPGTHGSVMAGTSMGKAFRADGIEFNRNEQAAYGHDLPDVFRQLFNSTETATVVAVTILAGPDKLPYAEILETYAPAVKWPSLRGKPSAGQLAVISLFGELLAGLEKR